MKRCPDCNRPMPRFSFRRDRRRCGGTVPWRLPQGETLHTRPTQRWNNLIEWFSAFVNLQWDRIWPFWYLFRGPR